MAITLEDRSALAEALAGHLRTRLESGEETVWVSQEAKDVLRALHRAKREGQRSSDGAVPAPAAPAIDEAAMPSLSAVAAELKGVAPPPEAGSDLPGIAAAPEELVPEGATAAEKIAWLKERAEDSSLPREMKSLRESMVFSVGNPEADLMLVGEAPGYEEERQGEPFVGPAGQLLDKILTAMGLARSDIYVSNVCKFRPAIPNQGTRNRKPTPEELAACLPFIMAEINVVEPKVIVALGATAVEGLLGEAMTVGRGRSRFHDYRGTPLTVTYHPSYLLRNQALGERRKVWEDMMMVMEEMGMPVSEKQRGYFLKK